MNYLENKYEKIFIIDSMYLWNQNTIEYSLETDLILTYDFELKKYTENQGGSVHFVDHLVDPEVMQNNNFIIYDYFRQWHYNKENEDIFKYKDVAFGFSFRVEFWNDYTSYIRLYLCLQNLLQIEYKKVIVLTEDKTITSVLDLLDIDFNVVSFKKSNEISYFFPIYQWMDTQIRPKGFRGFLYNLRELVSYLYGYLMVYIDKIFQSKDIKTVFIQDYHPTKEIIKILKKDKKINVLLLNFSKNSTLVEKLKERLLPIYGSVDIYEDIVDTLIKKFEQESTFKLILADGSDITTEINSIIISRVERRMPYILKNLNSVIKYFNNNKVDLEVIISNIGNTISPVDMVCKHNNVPSYLIANGLLGFAYLDDSKYATVINSYSESVKNNYFKGMDNIITLGDPRMDMYSKEKPRKLDRNNPTITIGAAGFNPVDLNSYVAFEFDFLYDILVALEELIHRGQTISIIIKVRPNGYKIQYESFIKKFFPKLKIEVIDKQAMKEVLLKTDFYISTYSQTLFEASCLGIPTIYYKKDKEFSQTPFDNNSELVTIQNSDDLIKAFYDFKNSSSLFNAFLDKKVMEKYIGPLDGHNLERNIDFINSLLDERKVKGEKCFQ